MKKQREMSRGKVAKTQKTTPARAKREDAWAKARRTHPVPDQVEPDVVFRPMPAPTRRGRSAPHG